MSSKRTARWKGGLVVDSFELLPSQKDPKGKNVICVICLLISLQVFLVSFEGCIYVGYIMIYIYIYKAFSPMPSIQNMVCQCRYHMDGRVSRKVGERSSR